MNPTQLELLASFPGINPSPRRKIRNRKSTQYWLLRAINEGSFLHQETSPKWVTFMFDGVNISRRHKYVFISSRDFHSVREWMSRKGWSVDEQTIGRVFRQMKSDRCYFFANPIGTRNQRKNEIEWRLEITNEGHRVLEENKQ